MTPKQVADLLDQLGRLRRASLGGGLRAPHKPLLLLWLLGLFARTGSSTAQYADLEKPVSELISDFGPPRTGSSSRYQAAMPFVYLERTLWQLHDPTGTPQDRPPPSRRYLLDHGISGRLRPEVELLLSDPATLSAAARLLLDSHFTPTLADLITDRVGLDLSTLQSTAPNPPKAARNPRDPNFPERVLRAYAYSCAICGFDGRLGRNPVGLQAAHVWWHSQGGPNTIENGLALCVLHHTLLDLGVLGITSQRTIKVSPLYVADHPSGQSLYVLIDQPVRPPLPGQPVLAKTFVQWHTRQVFKHEHTPT